MRWQKTAEDGELPRSHNVGERRHHRRSPGCLLHPACIHPVRCGDIDDFDTVCTQECWARPGDMCTHATGTHARTSLMENAPCSTRGGGGVETRTTGGKRGPGASCAWTTTVLYPPVYSASSTIIRRMSDEFRAIEQAVHFEPRNRRIRVDLTSDVGDVTRLCCDETYTSPSIGCLVIDRAYAYACN